MSTEEKMNINERRTYLRKMKALLSASFHQNSANNWKPCVTRPTRATTPGDLEVLSKSS